jgi:hypothetical protein
MNNIALSRWTMSYFVAALAAFVIAQALMVLGYGYPQTPAAAPATLALVHIVALGWLSLLLCGALFQFVPVLTAHPLYSNALPLPALCCLLAGVLALVCGFLQLAGEIHAGPPCFVFAAVLLAAGFGLVLWNLGRTLWAAGPLSVPARFVAVGLACLLAVLALGIVFALVLGGVLSYGPALRLTHAGLPVHIAAGLGGWLTFTAMGVSYRLLAMFMLAPELDGRGTRLGFYLGCGALAVAVVGGVTAIGIGAQATWVLLAAGALALACLALYGKDMAHLYRARKRRKIELNSKMAMLAQVSLALAVFLLLILLALGGLQRHLPALVYLLAFGWLSGLGLAKLYKIVPFLTWLECYGPVLGKKPTPRVQDLVTEQGARKWFLVYFAAVWLGSAALLAGFVPLFRITAAAALLGTAGVAFHLLRARLLLDVEPELRLPDGTRKPSILYSFTPIHS